MAIATCVLTLVGCGSSPRQPDAETPANNGDTQTSNNNSAAGAPNTGEPFVPQGCTMCDSGLFSEVESPGGVPVSLYADDSVGSDAQSVVFGIPFPPEVIDDVANIRVLDESGEEIPAAVTELARWRSLSSDLDRDSVRAARIALSVTFEDSSPVEIEVRFGEAREKELSDPPGNAKSTWVSMADGPLPNEYPAAAGIEEPPVWAAIPPYWLGASILRTRTIPTGADGWTWFDDFLEGAASTTINDVPDTVTEDQLVDYIGTKAPWLFDRAATLFGVYIRTGNVRWLRHAHRAAQFYSNHVDAQGFFDLEGDQDLKYSYGVSMLMDLMLTGDVSLLAPIERVAAATLTWPYQYQPGRFWTERHMTYSLLGVLTAWEATGKKEYADRIKEVVDWIFDTAKNPTAGGAAEGCLLHGFYDHEGDKGDEQICSPWMSALLGEAVWRYYLHSLDERALVFLAELADFIDRSALYNAEDQGLVVPWYLVSAEIQFSDSGEYADIEHTCDVLGLVMRGALARKLSGGDPDSLLVRGNELLTSCKENLANWHRPTNPEAPEWRLAPPRKFNWWFGTTLDMPWIFGDLGE